MSSGQTGETRDDEKKNDEEEDDPDPKYVDQLKRQANELAKENPDQLHEFDQRDGVNGAGRAIKKKPQKTDETDGCGSRVIAKSIKSQVKKLKEKLIGEPKATAKYLGTKEPELVKTIPGFESDEESDAYKNPNNFMGYMLVFANWKYKKGLEIPSRNISHVRIDIINAEQSWRSLGYDVRVYINKKTDEIETLINQYLNHWSTKGACSFGVTFMSHGGKNLRICTYDEGSWDMMNAVNIIKQHKNVRAKPKIICVQACRGQGKMQHVARKADLTLPVDADLLFFFCTTEGHFALRCDKISGMDQENKEAFGSWFIRGISTSVDKLKYGQEIEVIRLFTKVNRFVSQFEAQGDYKDKESGKWKKNEAVDEGRQVSEIKSTLRKDFILTKLEYEVEQPSFKVKLAEAARKILAENHQNNPEKTQN